MMKRRRIFTTIAALLLGTAAFAVLNERSLEQTLAVLRDGDGANMDEITISQDVRGSSYTINNLCDFGLDTPANYDATTGALQFMPAESITSFTQEGYGELTVHFMGLAGGYVWLNGILATATLDGASATITPMEFEDDGEQLVYTAMMFIAEDTNGKLYSFNGGSTVLPTTMTKSSASGAPKTNMLGHERAMDRFEAVLVKDKVLKLK